MSVFLYHGGVGSPGEASTMDRYHGFCLFTAKSVAVEVAEMESVIKGGDPVVSLYRMEDDALDSFVIKRYPRLDSEWLNALTAIRRGEAVKGPDLIIGPVLDNEATEAVIMYESGLLDEDETLQKVAGHVVSEAYIFVGGQPRGARFVRVVRDLSGKSDVLFELSLVPGVVDFIISRTGMNRCEAAEAFYRSRTFSLVADRSAGVWRLGPWMIFRLWAKEMGVDTSGSYCEEDEVVRFLVYCIELYRTNSDMTGNQVMDLFQRYGVMEHIILCHTVLRKFGSEFILEEMEEYIEDRRRGSRAPPSDYGIRV